MHGWRPWVLVGLGGAVGSVARVLLADPPVELLVLDEPTLGLDILYRKQFYQRLLEDYFDEDKTILVTTHQVEEIEHILTDVLFIRDGRIARLSMAYNLADWMRQVGG